MREVKRTERGWAGHFIGGADCRFQRNTLLECARRKIIVSTVGNYHPRGRAEIDTVGHLRYYETMAFHAAQHGPYIDSDASRQVFFDSPWSICADKVRDLPEEVDNMANDMHEAVVAELTARLQAGKKL